jgi:hypothetical protein
VDFSQLQLPDHTGIKIEAMVQNQDIGLNEIIVRGQSSDPPIQEIHSDPNCCL